MLKDIFPGPAGSRPQALVCVGDKIVFTANNGAQGFELWSSDGTSAGTRMVQDIRKGPLSAFPAQLTVCGDRVFFLVSMGPWLVELWRSDLTSSGTLFLRKGMAWDMTCSEHTLFFRGFDSKHGWELWKSDASPAGTQRITDINAGKQSSQPRDFIGVRKGIFFVADDGKGKLGRQAAIWFSDGSAAGTKIVCDLRKAPAIANPSEFIHCNGAMYFRAIGTRIGYELFRIRRPGASVLELGQGSPNSFATLTSSNPVMGGIAQHRYANGPRGHLGLALLSAPSAAYTVPGFFQRNASVFVHLPTLFILTSLSPPSGSYPLAIPNIAALKGLQVHSQVFWLKPAIAPIETSNALLLTLGS